MKHVRSVSMPPVEKAAAADILTIVGTVLTAVGGVLLSVAQIVGGGKG